MSKDTTRVKKVEHALNDAKVSQWCRVDINNEFKFMDKVFSINESVEDYKVYNKAGEVEDYTNEAYMEEILAVLYNNSDLRFYSQNYEQIVDVTLISTLGQK